MLPAYSPAPHFGRLAAWIEVILVVGTISLTSSVRGAAPANDRFSNRTPLPFQSGTTNGTNLGASKENNEPPHAGNPGGKSVWWSWTAPADGELVVTTDGSALDSLLAVYTGSSVSALSLVATNDDHSVFVTSRVRFAVASGVQYQIAVDGFNDAGVVSTGDILLNVAFTNGFVRPPNDSFAARQIITGSPLTVYGTNVHATREQDEPLHGEGFGDTSVWYQWSAPTSGVYQVQTAGSTFDTILSIYSGAALQSLTTVAANDDADPDDGFQTSRIFFVAEAGVSYAIAVDGFDGAAGQIRLEITAADVVLQTGGWNPDGHFQILVLGVPGQKLWMHASTNLLQWSVLGELVLTNPPAAYLDQGATNSVLRFYRAELMR